MTEFTYREKREEKEIIEKYFLDLLNALSVKFKRTVQTGQSQIHSTKGVSQKAKGWKPAVVAEMLSNG